jgi:hypothetical protein
MIMPDPTLVLPLEQWYTASDLRLFHTLPTAQILHCPTYGCSELTRNILKAIVSHVMKKFKLLWQNGFENRLKNSTPMGSKPLFNPGSVVSNGGGTKWKREV